MDASSAHKDGEADSLSLVSDADLWALAEPIRSSSRATPEKAKAMILRLCEGRFLTLQQLSHLLDRHPAGLRARLLSPMVRAHQLEWRYPTSPTMHSRPTGR
jgi:hypothetical protein